MPWQEERNRNSLSPHGRKEMEGHGMRGVHDINSVPCPEMGPGLLSMTPLGAGRSSPYAPVSAARPRDEPTATSVPHDPAPHPYSPAGQKQRPNTYMPKRP
jgi:hypothetical protein